MVAGIIAFVSCLLCAFPFYIIGNFEKDSREPIVFWTGDKSLKEKVKDVKEYNREMSGLYKKCALAFVVAGMSFVICIWAGFICLLLECSIGIFIAHRLYKQILARHS